MKKRLLAFCLTLCLLVGLLPTTVLAVPEANETGQTAEDPMWVPAGAMVIDNNTYYGVSKTWFTKVNPDKGTLYVALQIPNTVTTIANDAFRDNYTYDKTKYEAVTPNDELGQCKVAAIDFSQATDLTAIKYQAAMYCSDISGVLDLSHTKVKTIEKSAFNGCTGLTGVIFPSTLKNLTTPNDFYNDKPEDPVGSVFNGCTGLEFVRTADGNSNAVFELPGSLEVIGRQSFKGCTGLPANTTVEIPASVTHMGSEVFHYTTSVTTIVVKTNDASRYNGGAFKTSSDYGLGKRLTVFNNSIAKNSFKPIGSNSYANSLTYEFTLHYGEEGGTDARTEPKLYGQAVNVCKTEDGSWAVNADYEIPEADSANVPIGYSGGWAYNGKLLTTTTVLKPTGDHLYLDIQNVLQNPTVEFIVNGEKIETEGTHPELRVSAGSTIGVQVSHPAKDVDLKFEYEWIDVWGGGTEGPRMKEDGFGRYHLSNNPEVTNTITINGTEDERTSSGNYTNEDYGNGYYLLVIYGYSKPKSGGQWTKFYQSANTAIAPDPGRTVNTAYLFDVTIAEPITITPADITIYTGGEGYTGVVDSVGSQTTTANGLPEPGYYITLPDWINDQLGGDSSAENLTEYLVFKYDNEGVTREWELELYGTEAHSSNVADTERQRFIYRMLPGTDGTGQEIPVRLKLTDSDGNVTISDEFTPNMENQYREYTMSIFSGGLETSKITASLTLSDDRTVTCGVNSANGTLAVRGLTGEDITTQIIGNTDELSGGGITALAPKDVTYYINGSNVELKDTEDVRLLVDNVLDDSVLVNYIQESMTGSIPAGDYAYEQRYLDLVDTKNGNAYLTMGENDKLTIYWKVPEGFDDSKPFYVIHFDALNRNYDDLEDELSENRPDVITSKLVTVNGVQYVKFDTSSFSPFVLVWEKDSGGSVTPPATTYTITASAGEGGSISPSGKVSVSAGSSKTFTITPDEGNKVHDVVVDGRSVGALGSYTFDNVHENHTISVTFTRGNAPADPGDTGVDEWFDVVNHNEYLHGYDNGTNNFGPDDKMTRAQAAAMFYNMMKDKSHGTTNVLFQDVPEDAWYSEAVFTLASHGLVFGTSPTTFEPDRPITRAEFTAIAMRFSNGDVSGENIFTDVFEGDWYYEAIVGSIKYGWISGYVDGTGRFGPNDSLTRGQATAIANRMLGRVPDGVFISEHLDDLKLFSDVNQEHYAFRDIVEATNPHEYTKDGGFEHWDGLK